ncbi:MAG TPA: hypothetical protein VMV27_07310 [Candidatus Binataceae bacterium]|nr:hypothetical protein [Candidatus Binataceae bacterium]
MKKHAFPWLAGGFKGRARAMNCFFCGGEIEFRERVGFRDECPGCGRAQHACRNCGFYDPAYNNQCREPMAERVVDKERANFCEYFVAAQSRAAARFATRTNPRKGLDELFRKK